MDKCDPDFSSGRRRLLTAVAAGAGAAAAGAGQPAAAAVPPSALTAQTTEGPFYFDPGLVRADITEGLPGVALDVRLRIVDAAGTVLPGARVDLWHCDAAGFYSGFAGQGDDGTMSMEGRTFLRGIQHSDAAGIATFHTIYPGWYEGRTTHLHFKVGLDGRAVLTSQIFLPDALSEFLYTQLSAYRRDQLRDTLNRTDGIALMAGPTTAGSIREADDRYVASLEVVVARGAQPAVDRPPPPPGGDGAPPPRRRVARPASRLEGLIPGGAS